MYKLPIHTFIVLLCGFSFIAKAQYAGGSGVGFKSQSVIESSCSAPINANIYFGGSTNGFAYKKLIASVCTPPVNASIYFGGSADGFAYKPLITSVCAPPINTSIYFGGNSQGFAYRSLIASICPPPLNTSIYFGGNSEGFAYRSLIASICPPPINTSIYFGGNSEGFAYKPLITSICPPPLNASIYFGGNAAGFSFAKGNTANAGTWLGLSNNWSVNSNWCGGLLPTATTDVSIYNGVPFQPRLTANSFCNNLLMGTGATLSLNGQNLNVTGAFSGAGKIIGSTTSSMTIVGTGNAGTFNMSNASASEKTLSNLTISRTAGNVTLGDTLYLSTDLTLSNGTLNTAGKLRLRSTATKTARIGQVTGTGNVLGNVIAEKFAPGGSTGWANIGNSVNNDILLNWQDDFPTSGYNGSTGSAGGPFVSVYSYDETASGTYTNGYTPATNATNTVAIGKGYMVYMGTGATTTSAITIDATGPVQIGDFNLPVTYTPSVPTALPSQDGWNLIANPYCSTIDWDNANWVKTNVGTAIQYYNADAQNYAVYVAGNSGVGVNGATNLIAASQSFWLKASAANPVLTAKEAVKSAANVTLMRNSATLPAGFMKIKVSNSIGSDEAILRIDANATTNFDDNFDALKLYSFNEAVPNIATDINGTKYCINAFDNTSTLTEIPLEFKAGSQGICTMAFEGVSGFSQGMYLKDNEQQSVTPLNGDTTISLFVQNISAELNRYSIVFNNVVTKVSAFPLNSSINIYPNPAKETLNVDFSLKNVDLKVVVVDMLGNEIINENLRNQHTSLNIQNLSSGVYFVKVINGNECVGIKKWVKE
ncbi:MAG: T9SS type A sorting domain-containing protein [Bacteroidota bacterium]